MADPPTPTPEDWQKAQRVIRALFLQEKYRQCIQVCRDVLKATADDHDPHPLQDAYINFYLGLCHNEVARIMHHNSVAKLPAYDDAEKHYLEALTALPTAKDARALCIRRLEEEMPEDPFVEQSNDAELPASPTITESDYFDRPPNTRPNSLMLSSPPIRHQIGENIPFGTPLGSPALGHSDLDVKDVESHESFSEIVTPSRVKRDFENFDQITPIPRYLRREASRMSMIEYPARNLNKPLPRVPTKMSLLDKTPPRPKPPVQTNGLMRPIRMGSPGKRNSAAPVNMPYSGAFQRSNLPRLATGWDPRMSAPQLGQYNTRPTSPDFLSPVSPVSPSSPLGSHGSSVSPVSPIATDGLDYMYSSGASTKSTFTPSTPPDVKQYSTPAPADYSAPAPAVMPVQAMPAEPKEVFDAAMFARVTDHLTAMRAQLETHMKTVQQAKEQIHRAQALQALNRPRSNGSNRGMFSAVQTRSTTTGCSLSRQKSLQKSRSFWSFAPEDQKARKKKERIEAGRERKWKKERFDPTKYQRLCEHALNEL